MFKYLIKTFTLHTQMLLAKLTHTQLFTICQQPPVCISPVFPRPDDPNTYFFIKHEMEWAQDSTQDVRLEAWHRFPQQWNVLMLFILFWPPAFILKMRGKGVVLLLGSAWVPVPWKNTNTQQAGMQEGTYSLKIDQQRKCRRLLAADVCRTGVHQHMTSINKMQTAGCKEYWR